MAAARWAMVFVATPSYGRWNETGCAASRACRTQSHLGSERWRGSRTRGRSICECQKGDVNIDACELKMHAPSRKVQKSKNQNEPVANGGANNDV